MAPTPSKKSAEGENKPQAPVTSNDDATVDAVKDAPNEIALSETVLDDRKVVETEGEFKPKVMSGDYKDVFTRKLEDSDKREPLKGDFIYLGATTYFECRAKKEHSLVRGKTYDIAKLPNHEVIGNALLRRLLVKADDQPKAEA